jgi:hypothetical protein
MTIIGTSHFVNVTKACDYYKTYVGIDWQFTPAELEKHVRGMLDEGEIHLGKPDVPVGARLVVIDNGCRYAIEEA